VVLGCVCVWCVCVCVCVCVATLYATQIFARPQDLWLTNQHGVCMQSYPKGLKYIALFPKSADAATQAAVDIQRQDIRDLIATAKRLGTSTGAILGAAARASTQPTAGSGAPVSGVATSLAAASVRFQHLGTAGVSTDGVQISDDEGASDDDTDRPAAAVSAASRSRGATAVAAAAGTASVGMCDSGGSEAVLPFFNVLMSLF